MRAKESLRPTASIVHLLEEAAESHVSPYLNNAYADHGLYVYMYIGQINE